MKPESISLYFKEGSSDKEYHAQLKQDGDGWVVTFQYGRRGTSLTADTKTKGGPVDFEQAKRIYDKLTREKLGKGYRPAEVAAAGYVEPAKKAAGSAPIPERTELPCELLTEIETPQDAAKYIIDRRYWMQEKRDGRRLMVRKDANGLTGYNKLGGAIPLHPVLHAHLSKIQLDTFVLDGEIEGDMYIVFDVLNLNGDITHMTYEHRFGRVYEFKTIFPIVQPVRTWREADDKETGIAEMYKVRAEGVVFKLRSAPYRPGRNGQHLKFKFTKTLTARVARNHPDGKSSVFMELLDKNGKWVEVGGVTVPPKYGRRTPGELIEVRYLYATADARLYQASYLGVRDDVNEADCTMAQMIYKKGVEAA